jgi:hypothetical protein
MRRPEGSIYRALRDIHASDGWVISWFGLECRGEREKFGALFPLVRLLFPLRISGHHFWESQQQSV